MKIARIAPAALWLFTGALGACSAPLPSTVATFDIGGVSFRFRVPDGFCLPNDRNLKRYQGALAFNDMNTVFVTAYKRNGGKFSYDGTIYISSPDLTLAMQFNRKGLLDSLGDEFNKPENLAWMESGGPDNISSKDLSKAFGPGISVKSRMKPMGRDNVCAYLGGGSVTFRNDKNLGSANVGTCITVVQKKLIQITVAGTKGDPSNLISLLRETKSIAAILIEQNESD